MGEYRRFVFDTDGNVCAILENRGVCGIEVITDKKKVMYRVKQEIKKLEVKRKGIKIRGWII